MYTTLHDNICTMQNNLLVNLSVTPSLYTVNGYCVRPGECLCQDGYGGDLCTLGKIIMSVDYIPFDCDILSVAEASPKSQSHHVTYIVVGIVLGVLVAVVLLVLLLLLWKRHTVKQIFCK